MYDRYTISANKETIEKLLNVKVGNGYTPTYNGAPTHQLPVIIQPEPNEVKLFQWGFMSGLSNNKSISPRLFNLPVKGVFERPMYRKLLDESRCVILADGFYAWKQVSKKQRVPYYFYFPNRTIFGIAGVWEASEDIDGNISESFNMITLEADQVLSSYQEDMPAVIPTDKIGDWLQQDSDQGILMDILKSVNLSKLQTHPVSPRINDLKESGEHLIKPAAPSDQFGNYTLFN